MKIEDGKRVRIQVKLTVVGGDVIENSVATYFQGAGTIIPGLEKALAGLEAGAEKSGVVPADEAFSAVAKLPPKKIPRAEFPKDAKLEVGEVFGARGPDGSPIQFEIHSVTDSTVEVHFVHPLAGKDIAYEVKVVSVSDPVPPPLPLPDDAVVEEED